MAEERHGKKPSAKQRRTDVLLACAVVLALAAAVWAGVTMLGGDKTPASGAAELQTAGLQLSGDVTVSEEGEDLLIETPVLTLHYPLAWKDRLSVDCAQDGGLCVVTFRANVPSGQAELFTVLFGDGDSVDARKLGTAGDADVLFYAASDLPAGDWSQADADVVYAMMEDANYLLERLDGTENFIPAE